MKAIWYGQSAFRLEAREGCVVVDPFADMSGARSRGMVFDYPPIPQMGADVLLITHEHFDHSGAQVVKDPRATVRSTAGTFDTPIGTVVAVASEHDQEAGTRRGPNAIFVWELEGIRIAHFGDFGQSQLRPEQKAAIGHVDLAFIPAGAGPTIGGAQAWEIGTSLGARWIVPMHYRTPAVNFLETLEAFEAAATRIHETGAAGFDTVSLPTDGPVGVVLKAPAGEAA